MKKSLLILLIVELGLAIGLGLFGHVYRSETRRAFFAWRQNPTPQTRQTFDREKQISEIQLWGISGVFFAVLAGSTILIYRLVEGEPDAPPNRRPPQRLPKSPEVPAPDSLRTPSSGGCG